MDWEMRTASVILCLGFLLATIQNGIAERKIVCYYTNWSVYRPGTAKFSPQNINPYLCTHLIYAFGGFTKDNALKPFDKYQDIEKGGYAKFTGLKTYNKNLKTMLAIGGWNEGSSRFSPMVADSARRREFVKNSVKFLRQNHFDGLDLDWEYPAFRDGGKPRDKDNYANLVQELREEFERESSKTGRPRLLLSMAMPAGIEYIDKGYDVPRLNEYLDFINLLSYDYHSAYEPAVNHHSPLYPLEEDNEYNYDAELTIDYTISHLLEKGASADKIVLGIPTYGRSYTLFNVDATELGSPADGPGVEGEATREKGYLAYYEICEGIAESDEWEVVQPNPNAMGPYAFKGDQWVGYDDEDIVRLKSRYVNEKKLGGIMFWSIDNDDFRGKCHGRAYPLIEAAKEALLTDNSKNTIDKTKSTDSRKKTRTQGAQSNVARKSSGRRSTTSAPITSKRVSSSRPKYRTITRPKASDEEQEDREVSRRSYDPSSEEDIEGRNTVRVTEKTERPKNRNRSKTRNSSADRSTRRKQSRRKGQKNDENGESLSNTLTTPEPPTTPDPGTDFKCEDEGFFPHPRDCKKYFWCLDSGPGGLGVVAHQFTCPSGLVFNKAADSCDYPRNVICPKTSKTSVVSTTRSPITAATSRTTYLHSTTTTKTESEDYDSEEDYEEDEIEESEEEEVNEEPKTITTAKPLVYKTLNRNRPSATTTTSKSSEPERVSFSEDEEDPRVIKELIDLIKKAGGIEQLEKQLLIQDKSSDTTSGSENITPATISRSLYERVLSRQVNKIGSQQSILSSSRTSYVNGPGRAQFEGLDDIPEVKSLRRSNKHQYVTIERPKSATKESPSEDEDIDEDEEDDNTDVASFEEETVSNPSERGVSAKRVSPNYVNIRRTRPSTTTSRTDNDVGEKEEEVEEEKPTRRRRPFVSSKQQDNEASSETSKLFRNRPSGFRNSEKRDNSKDTDRSAEKDDGSSTKSRYINIQRFRSTTSKASEDLSSAIPLSEVTIESTSPTRPEEYLEVSSTTPSTIISSSTVPATTVSTSTEVITVISIEPPENPSSVEPRVNTTSSTTDSVRLVEDSATEILLTTMPAASSSSQSTTTTTTLASRSTIAAAVSQPRPFGFTRRRSGSSEGTTVSTTPLSRSKVADSEVIRLPTLRELIGYPTTYYDDSIVATPPSVLLHLPRDDVDNDISRQNVDELFGGTNESRDNEEQLAQSPRVIAEEIGDYWLRQASENKAKSRAPKKIDIEEQTSITKTISEDGNEWKKSSISIFLKPTTMRGIPLVNLTPSPMTRGFYVTRSENDSSSSTTMDDFVSLYTTTENPVEQQTETTLISDISTTNEIFTVTRNDQKESKSDTRNNDTKDILNDEAATILYNNRNESRFDIPNDIINNEKIDIHEEKFSTLSSSEDSSAEDLLDYEEPDAIAISISRPASKRGKSLRNFGYNTTPFPNAHVISPTSPTRRKIALAVSRYNEVTTPLWTGKRIVRKRIRTTVSPIKNAIRQIESSPVRSTANAFESASATSTISSTFTSARREPPTTSTIPTIAQTVSESTIPLEVLNIRRNYANSINKEIEDPKNHTTAEATLVTLTSSVIPATPLISKITSTTSNPTVDIISTIPYDSTSTTIRASTDASVITTIPSTIAVAKTPAVATHAIITTTSAIMSAEIETNFVTANYSITAIPTIINTNIIATDSAIVTDSTIATDSAITTAPATANTEIETASIIENSTATIPAITNMNVIASESATVTDFTITAAPAPATANTEVETASIIENFTVPYTIPAITNTQTIATDSAITTTPAAMNTEIETTFTLANYSAVTIPETANTHEVATDTADTSTQQITSIKTDTISTIANYSVDAIPTTMYMHGDITDSVITTISATENTEVETTSTIANSRLTIPAIMNTRATTIPATTVSPLTTVILPTANTHTDATAPVTVNNLADTNVDTVTTNMITTTTPATVIPMTTDPNLITTSANTDTSSTITSAIIETLTTTQSRISSVTSSKDPITSTYTASISSAAPTTLTTESSTIYFANTSVLDINSNSDTLAVTEIAKSTQNTEIPTIFETSPVISSTTVAISKSLPTINSEMSSAATIAFSTQTDESSFTPINTQTPSMLSIITPIIDTVTVASEKSAVFSTLPATFRESIATNAIIRTTTNAYEPNSVRTSEESTAPDLKIDFEKATSRVIQSRTKYRTTTSTYEPSSAQTTNEVFTTPDLKIDSKQANSKTIRSRTRYRTTTSTYEPSSAQTTNEESTTPEIRTASKEVTSNGLQSQEQNQTTSKLDSTDYQLRQKSSRRRVVNRTNNWNGRPAAQQTSNQYPRHRVTVYRGQPRRPPSYASSSRVEANHRRRIIQKRVRLNSEAISSTIQPDKNTDDVQNITEEHIANNRAENVRRRMKVIVKRVKEKVKEEVTTLPTKETTVFLQSSTSTDNETPRAYPENGNIGRRRKIVLKRIKPQSKKNYTTEEISVDSTTIDPTTTDSTTIITTTIDITTSNNTISNNTTSNKSLPDNSQNNLHVGESLLKKEKMRRRMRVILKSVKPISEENNSTEETSTDSELINKNLQGNFSSNLHKNLSDKRNTRRMRVILKSVRPKSNEKNSTIEEASVNLNSTDENLQENLSNNITTSKNLPDKEQTRRRMRVVVKRVRPKSEERETKVEEASVDSNSTNDNSQTTVSSNLRRGKNLSVEHGIRRRMRVVLKSIKPKSEEKNPTTEETSVNPDSTDKDLQGSFSSNFHKDLSNEKEARKRMEVVLKNVKLKSEEVDSIAEETNAEPDYVNEYPPVIFTLNSPTGLPKQENTMTQSEFKEQEMTTEQLDDTELQTAETSVPVEEDTDWPSLEVNSPKNGGSISRKVASGHSNRHRKPTQSTTVAPNTLSSTLTTHRRGRPVETTLSSRIDLDVFEGTESYIKSTAVEGDQKTDVSDQSIHAQEFAVTLADPPTSSSDIGRTVLRDAARRKISTTLPPRTDHTTTWTVRRYGADFRNRQGTRTKDKPIVNVTTRPRRPPVIDYDYYEDDAPIVLGKSALNSKLFLTSKGAVHCLDQGNFPHPYSCKKFITCARMVNGLVIGTEYTCPDKLSFDPVGGICNWSAGLGCKD